MHQNKTMMLQKDQLDYCLSHNIQSNLLLLLEQVQVKVLLGQVLG
jgi:hypothetical protein